LADNTHVVVNNVGVVEEFEDFDFLAELCQNGLPLLWVPRQGVFFDHFHREGALVSAAHRQKHFGRCVPFCKKKKGK